MDTIIGLFTGLSGKDTRKDDDFVDRLSNKYSVLVLMAFATVVCMHQYVGDPIVCLTPDHFTDSHTKFMNSICWVNNTYFVPFEEELPKEDELHKFQKVTYYQWIPFILLSQALLFYLPCVLWHSFNQKSGVDADNILSYAQSFSKADQKGDKQNTLTMVRNQMDRFLVSRKSLKPEKWKHIITKRGVIGRRFGSYLVSLYILSKILYLVNVVSQLLLLNKVLAIEYGVYGIEIIQWILSGTDWSQSPTIAFPRVTVCNFHIRTLGNVHRYTAQCALPINLYNEKIYMFLWFWLVLVAVFTCISLLIWIARIVYPQDRITFVRNHLKMLRQLKSDADNEKAIKFVNSYLQLDGVFLLRLIEHNTNTLSVTDIISELWKQWKKRQIDNIESATISSIRIDKPNSTELKPVHNFAYMQKFSKLDHDA